jgi:DNA-binding transcriptional LysR family regulator
MDRFMLMRTFARVAEKGSLSAAARDLALTQPAISQQITALERELQVRLLHRTTRGLTLTDEGERYYQRVKDILGAVEEAAEALKTPDGPLNGLVRVQAPSGFGQLHVAPSLIAFKQRHPDLVVDLILEDRISDLVSEGVDLAIRLGEVKSPGLTVRRLGKIRRLLVASPAYARERGLPRAPEDLHSHPFVRFSWMASGDDLTLVGPDGPMTVETQATFLANNAFALIEAVRSGLGIGAVQGPLVHGLLQEGELVEVLPDWAYPPLDMHAVYPSRRFIPRRVRALVEHLAATLAHVPGMA